MGSGVRQALSRREGQRERSAREEVALDRALGKEVGNGRFAIYTSGRSG